MKQDLIDEEDLKICILDILELRCFSSMLPSMPKGEIVSMNADDTILGVYPKHWRVLTCCIHDCVYF